MSEKWPGAEYARRIQAGELAYQHCDRCGEAIFFPRVLCPACGSTELSWRTSGGRGTVYSATTIYSRNRDPYTVALVDLDEGVRLMTRIEDATPGEPPIGSTVEVRPVEIDGEPATVARLQGGGTNG
ncbi:MAG: OB-fold domain-containing protein [Thermoleophilaceae bacterium]|nr:OB-fold domain-containing protein [Thermoleophilaceae bacterium]